jgi:hypothetical protein
MIKVIERKHSIQIVCSRADWAFVSWCMDEGLAAWIGAERDDNPSGDDEAYKAWKRNGQPGSLHDLTQVDKS